MYKLIFQFLKLGKRSKGYFVITIGKVSAETIQKYIKEQKTKKTQRLIYSHLKNKGGKYKC